VANLIYGFYTIKLCIVIIELFSVNKTPSEH